MFSRVSIHSALIAGATSLALAAAAFAAQTLSHGDVKFMQKAAADGIAEVELGKLAQQKAWSRTTPTRTRS